MDKKSNKQFVNYIFIFGLLYLIMFYFSFTIDITRISFKDFILSLSKESLNANKIKQVIIYLRLPRIIEASIVGASLALSGALMQTVLANNLASPFTLGISSASSFGASLAIIVGTSFFHGRLLIVGNAFLFACLSLVVLYIIIARSGSSKKTIILAGISINYFFSSMNVLLQHFSSAEAVYEASFWTTGSLSKSSYQDILILLIILIISICITALTLNDASNIMNGERDAKSIGINTKLVRIVLLGVSSLSAATAVSMVGIIGFVGLVSPHICRLLGFKNPKQLIPMSMLIGALLLVIADFISRRLISPTILPIGAITSLIGVPFFLLLMRGISKNE
jgi:iron complex transport system permease protein